MPIHYFLSDFKIISIISSLICLCLTFQITIEFLGRIFCFTCSKQNRKPKLRKVNSLLEDEEEQKMGTNGPSNTWNHVTDTANSEQHGPSNTWDHVTMASDNINKTTFSVEQNPTNSDYSCKLRILEKNCIKVTRQLGEVKSILEVIMQTEQNKDKQARELKSIVKEWKLVALCLDRLFFCLYLVSIVLSLLFLFPRPQEWNSSKLD